MFRPCGSTSGQSLIPKKNPFYQHGRIDPILAKRGHEIVGRIASIDDDNHNRTHGDNTGFFGFFEAVDDEVAETLFAEVEARARASGRAALRGPLNPSMNDGAGFQIDAFESAPFVMMPQNPPAYPEYAEAAGVSQNQGSLRLAFLCSRRHW